MNRLLTYLILIIVASTAVGFGTEEPEVITYQDEETGELVKDTMPFYDLRDYPDIQNETNVDSLIIGIIRTNCVHAKRIGIGGTYSKQYARYERLTKLLSEEEMLDLTKHANPSIRLYAFKGLELKKSDLLEEARQELNNDTTQVCFFSGCIEMNMSIFMMVIHPDSIK